MFTPEINMEVFTPGLEVIYDEKYAGVIRFVSEDYLTVCVNPYSSRHSEVCICIPPERWNRIILPRHSTK